MLDCLLSSLNQLQAVNAVIDKNRQAGIESFKLLHTFTPYNVNNILIHSRVFVFLNESLDNICRLQT